MGRRRKSEDSDGEEIEVFGKPSAVEMLEAPPSIDFGPKRGESAGDETPFDKTYSSLTITGGATLEMLTRTTKPLAKAIGVGYLVTANFRSPYVQGRVDSLMRVAVSAGGKGRTEMVQCLSSGSGVGDGFYNQGGPTLNSFVDINDGAEDGEEE